jgi:hypothetical protein
MSWFEDPRYDFMARALRDQFLSARPFPNICIDNFLPEEAAERALREYPDLKSQVSEDGRWVRRKHCSNGVPPGWDWFFGELQSQAAMRFLWQLTGIEDLQPDPTLGGGGLHEISRGGFLKMHVDFNAHKNTGMPRLLNMLYFLNKDWQEEWGGNIELWDWDTGEMVHSFSPIFNRVVIFLCSEKSLHGHPTPLECPHDRTRKGAAIYYYGSKKFEGKRHTTIYRRDLV